MVRMSGFIPVAHRSITHFLVEDTRDELLREGIVPQLVSLIENKNAQIAQDAIESLTEFAKHGKALSGFPSSILKSFLFCARGSQAFID